MSNVFFTSDLHLGHGNSFILGHRERVHSMGFKDVHHMNEWIISSMNNVLGRRDHLYILGDVAFGQDSLKLLSAINGTKSLIFGNHDKLTTREYLKYFCKLHGLLRKYGMVFSHCPLLTEELKFRNWCLNVHGHIHHKERQPELPCYYNVNIDIAGCRPVPLEELRAAKVKAEEWFKEVCNESSD